MTATVYRDQLDTDVTTLRDLLTVHHADSPPFGLSWWEICELAAWTWDRMWIVVETGVARGLMARSYTTGTVYLERPR